VLKLNGSGLSLACIMVDRKNIETMKECLGPGGGGIVIDRYALAQAALPVAVDLLGRSHQSQKW